MYGTVKSAVALGRRSLSWFEHSATKSSNSALCAKVVRNITTIEYAKVTWILLARKRDNVVVNLPTSKISFYKRDKVRSDKEGDEKEP